MKFLNKLIYIFLIHSVFTNNINELNEIYAKLNIDTTMLPSTIILEEKKIVSIGYNILNKEIFLSEKCAQSWIKMKNDALKGSMQISVLSGFRSYYKQYAIINNKLQRGMIIAKILEENKLPGFSQHHSGNAIDIITNSYKLSLEFEKSLAYAWLIKNAYKYGFYLQYPKNNKEGIMFEPWHWCFEE